MTNEPKTWAEKLDAAAALPDNGEAFLGALMGIFSALDKARDEEGADEVKDYAQRYMKVNPPAYCNRCGIPHTDQCRRGEGQ